MKADRQQKEGTSSVIQPSKGGGGYIVDNRPVNVLQGRMIDAIHSVIQRDDDEINTFSEEELSKGTIMYKGTSSIEEPTSGNDKNDWGGCYLSNTLEQAKEYVYSENKEVDFIDVGVWKVTLKEKIQVLKFNAGFLQDSKITGERKSELLKNQFGIETLTYLQKGLFEKKEAYYYGLSNDENDDRELIIPWAKVRELLDFKLYMKGKMNTKTYEVEWK